MLFLAADHAGFSMKSEMSHRLAKRGVIFEDLGTFSDESVDYPGIARKLAKAVVKHGGKGIMICGSGEGMAIAANRHKGVRAAVVWNKEVARETREDNDANVISLPARFIDDDTAWDIISTFLSTTFSHEERHKRRIEQIDS
jgi:ribose 5-phosphate isomerase B